VLKGCDLPRQPITIELLVNNVGVTIQVLNYIPLVETEIPSANQYITKHKALENHGL